MPLLPGGAAAAWHWRAYLTIKIMDSLHQDNLG
jgi:hypothetical protein